MSARKGSQVSERKGSQRGSYNPSLKAKRVLALLLQGYKKQGISKATNTTVRNVEKIFAKLRKKGLLDATNVPIAEMVRKCLDTLPQKECVLVCPLRLHALIISAKWKAGATSWQVIAKKVVLGNGVVYWLNNFKDSVVQLFESGRVVIYPPEFLGKSAAECDANFLRWLSEWFVVFEQAFGLRLERDADSAVVWKLSRKHYAYEGHVFGEAVKEVTERADIKVEDAQGVLRLWTDQSRGAVDLEVAKGSDARRIIEARIREYFVEDRLAELDKTVGRVAQLVSIHDDVLKGRGGQ